MNNVPAWVGIAVAVLILLGIALLLCGAVSHSSWESPGHAWLRPEINLAPQHPWIALPLSLVVAIGSYHLIESPFRRRRTASPGSSESPAREPHTSSADTVEAEGLLSA